MNPSGLLSRNSVFIRIRVRFFTFTIRVLISSLADRDQKHNASSTFNNSSTQIQKYKKTIATLFCGWVQHHSWYLHDTRSKESLSLFASDDTHCCLFYYIPNSHSVRAEYGTSWKASSTIYTFRMIPAKALRQENTSVSFIIHKEASYLVA